MERHGRDQYYVVGEGVLTGDGAATPDTSSAGVAAGAVEAAAAAPPRFRFSRIGPRGRVLGLQVRRKVAVAMTSGRSRPGHIPAGFTYLGQFVDHDLTFDVTATELEAELTVEELLQARSPRLDLDSLYGGGPKRVRSKKFYADGARLKMGRTAPSFGGGNADISLVGFDLPRVGAPGPAERRRPALIPDKRNDENLAVAQTHLAMIRFHNRVVDHVAGQGVAAADRFRAARQLVVRHYQWMLRTDYLPRFVSAAILDDVFRNGRKLFEVGAAPTSTPTMPIEFAIAAYRHGHSMVRDSYNWNRVFDFGTGTLGLLFDFSSTGGLLGGGVRLPSNWIADFRRLYDFGEAGRADLTVPAASFNQAMKIDTRLVDPLSRLPAGTFGGGPGTRAIEANLAFRNLSRARMVHLATGQQMVAFLQSRGVAVTPLTDEQILEGTGGARLGTLTPQQRELFLRRTPLWFYVLREAETGRGRLRGVGGRIVAETFHRAMEGSTPSILQDPTWRPTLGPDPTTFRMVDLLLFAFEGRADLLNPIGP